MAGQSDSDLSLFSPEEIEFMAEDEMIEIVPNMKMDPLNLVSGDFGPFMPQIATHVPLWLAVALRKRGKCTISCPEWMSVEKLTEVLEAERESPNVFLSLPFHYIEISRLLFDHAREDITDTYMVRSLVEDIQNVRLHKIEVNLKGIQNRVHAVKIKNLSAMEVNIVRRFLVRSLQAFYKHDSPEMIDQVEPSTIQRPQATNTIPRIFEDSVITAVSRLNVVEEGDMTSWMSTFISSLLYHKHHEAAESRKLKQAVCSDKLTNTRVLILMLIFM